VATAKPNPACCAPATSGSAIWGPPPRPIKTGSGSGTTSGTGSVAGCGPALRSGAGRASSKSPSRGRGMFVHVDDGPTGWAKRSFINGMRLMPRVQGPWPRPWYRRTASWRVLVDRRRRLVSGSATGYMRPSSAVWFGRRGPADTTRRACCFGWMATGIDLPSASGSGAGPPPWWGGPHGARAPAGPPP